MGDQLTQIRELIELPIRHPKLFTTIGVRSKIEKKIENVVNCVHYILDCNYRNSNFYYFIPVLLSSL